MMGDDCGMGIFDFFKRKEEEVEYIPPVETRLYLLVEYQKQGLIQYFHENNVEVFFISDSPEALLDECIMIDESIHSRILIIDSGKSKFDDRKTLDTIEEIIEVVLGENGSVSLFSNSTHFNHSRKKCIAKNRDWEDRIDVFKYSGAVDILSHLQDYNESYIEGGAEDIIPENVLEFTPSSYAVSDKDRKTLNDITRGNMDINMREHVISENIESLPRYGK